MFKDNYNIPLIHANEQDLFLKALEHETDPEKKRKIIGALFIEVFQKHASMIDGAEFLAQGTFRQKFIKIAGKNQKFFIGFKILGI